MKKTQKGKLIVFDGNDGGGKQTQTELLIKRLAKEGYKSKTIDFPRYYDNFFGKFIGECLIGEYGNFLAIDPHIASVLYAADRFESTKQIKEWIDKGYVVFCDRYVSANQIHQGGKIADPKKRKKFIEWLDKMEYGVFGLARPDAVVYFDIPVEASLENLKKKAPQKYAKGKQDQTENDRTYLEHSRACALWFAKQNKNWITIKCAKGKTMRTREDIHEEIFSKIKELL